MTPLLAAGIAMAMAAAAPTGTVHHAADVDHHSGPVRAQYRGDVTVAHRQVGMPAPGGRMATLRCAWSASMTVNREAKAASGATISRTFARDDVLTGTRPGWCSTQRGSIAQEVAARLDRSDGHLQAMAREDHEVLRAELDRAHPTTRTG